MSDNKRNIDSPDIGTGDKPDHHGGRSNPYRGNQSSTGTGSHAVHQQDAADQATDNKAKGNEARLSGYGKGQTRPESGQN